MPNAHQAIKVPSRQATPEVTGWATQSPTLTLGVPGAGPTPPAFDALSRSGRKMKGGRGVAVAAGGGGSRVRSVYGGRPALMDERNERLMKIRETGAAEKNRTENLLKAAGLF